MDLEGNLVEDTKGAIKMGSFMLCPIRLRSIPQQTNCIWEIIWRGKLDTHATTVLGDMKVG